MVGEIGRRLWPLAERGLLRVLAKPDRKADANPKREAGGRVHSGDSGRRVRRQARNEIILGFPKSLVVQIVDGDVEVHAMADSLGDAEINNIESECQWRRWRELSSPQDVLIEDVVADVAIAQGSVDASPVGHC